MMKNLLSQRASFGFMFLLQLYFEIRLGRGCFFLCFLVRSSRKVKVKWRSDDQLITFLHQALPGMISLTMVSFSLPQHSFATRDIFLHFYHN